MTRLSDESRGYKDSVGHFLTTERYTTPIVKGKKKKESLSKALLNKMKK